MADLRTNIKTILECAFLHIDESYMESLTDRIIEQVNRQSNEVARPQGEWLGTPEKHEVFTRICASCGRRGVIGSFCMWCGADMRKSEKKND